MFNSLLIFSEEIRLLFSLKLTAVLTKGVLLKLCTQHTFVVKIEYRKLYGTSGFLKLYFQ